MRKLLLIVLALTLVVIVAGLTAVHAAGHRHEHGQNAKRSPRKTVTHRPLSQQRILALGCGPLTQAAAEDVLRRHLHGRCR
jgi:hypothetical protein